MTQRYQIGRAFRANRKVVLLLDGLDSILTVRTRIVALTAVSNVLGTINTEWHGSPSHETAKDAGSQSRLNSGADSTNRASLPKSGDFGYIGPLAAIIQRAHDVGAVVLVDAAQSVPHLPTDVQALDADFLAFSGHKMLGPSH